MHHDLLPLFILIILSIMAMATPNDPEWLATEFPKHVSRVRRTARSMLIDPDDADDAVAIAIMKTTLAPDIPDSFGAYLNQAVRSAATDIQRRRARLPVTVSLDEVLYNYDLCDRSASPEDELIAAEYRKIIRFAVSELPVPERRAIELHYFDELTIRETAVRLGLTQFQVTNNLHKARLMLLLIIQAVLNPARFQRHAW